MTHQSIRTPDQRLRVFVSSTLNELADERAVVRDSIHRIRLTPVMFEIGARAHPPRDLYRAYLAQSDVFVGIYWQRYGWVAPGEVISGLEDEYLLARDKPKLVYVKRAEGREDRLDALIDRIQGDHVSFRPFSEPDELAELVQNDLAVMLTERFAQAAAQAAPAEPVAEAPPPWLPPVERGALVGRDGWLATAQTILDRPDAAVITLTGPGGTGKTRLGAHLAHGADPARYPDGVYYVPLAGVRSSADVASAIATTLQVPVPPQGGDPEALLASFLRPQAALLVLDNFEHLLEAAGLVGRLVAACPRLRVVVTSREALRIRGERELPVPPLPHTPNARSPDSPAMLLFEQRAQEMRPDFAIDDDNRHAVAEICRRLDALPLAIELAAARIRVLTPQAMLPRLDQCLTLLKGGRRDLPARHQTLHATLTWSHDLLAVEERAFFRRLGTFVGGFSEEAAAAVVGDVDLDVLDGLTSLVDKSLVVRGEVVGEPRFHLLETVREFALERLREAGEEATCRRRHLAWVTAFLDAAADRLMGRHHQRTKDRVGLERENARAALRFAAEDRDPEATWRLFTMYAVARIAEAAIRDVLDAAATVGSVPLPEEPRLRAQAQGAHAWARLVTMDVEAAEDLARAVTQLEALGDRRMLPGLLTAHAMATSYVDVVAARPLTERAIALCEATGQEAMEAWARSNLCQFLQLSGQTEAAWEATRAFIARARSLGDDDSAAFAHTMLGRMQFADGQLETARETFAAAAAMARSRAGVWARMDALTCLANVALVLDDQPAASAVLEEVLFLGQRVGVSGLELMVGAYAGLVARAGDPTSAALLLQLLPPGFEEQEGPFVLAVDPTGAFAAATREARALTVGLAAPRLEFDEVLRRVLGA